MELCFLTGKIKQFFWKHFVDDASTGMYSLGPRPFGMTKASVIPTSYCNSNFRALQKIPWMQRLQWLDYLRSRQLKKNGSKGVFSSVMGQIGCFFKNWSILPGKIPLLVYILARKSAWWKLCKNIVKMSVNISALMHTWHSCQSTPIGDGETFSGKWSTISGSHQSSRMPATRQFDPWAPISEPLLK